MRTSSRRILVIGGTGRCGAAVVRALLADGHDVAVLTRDARTERAARLGDAGARLVTGDVFDPPTLERAFRGVERSYVVTTPEHGLEQEVRAGGNVVAAAARADVEHVVLQSVVYAETAMPHCATKRQVELALEASGLSFTVLRAGYFVETLPLYLTEEAVANAEITSVIRPDAPVWWVAVPDLAVAAGRLLGAAEPPSGRFDAVSPDAMSFAEVTAELARLTGRPWHCRHVRLTVAQMFKAAVSNGMLSRERADELLTVLEEPDRDYYEEVSSAAVTADPRPLERITAHRFSSPRVALARLARATS